MPATHSYREAHVLTTFRYLYGTPRPEDCYTDEAAYHRAALAAGLNTLMPSDVAPVAFTDTGDLVDNSPEYRLRVVEAIMRCLLLTRGIYTPPNGSGWVSGALVQQYYRSWQSSQFRMSMVPTNQEPNHFYFFVHTPSRHTPMGPEASAHTQDELATMAVFFPSMCSASRLATLAPNVRSSLRVNSTPCIHVPTTLAQATGVHSAVAVPRGLLSLLKDNVAGARRGRWGWTALDGSPLLREYRERLGYPTNSAAMLFFSGSRAGAQVKLARHVWGELLMRGMYALNRSSPSWPELRGPWPRKAMSYMAWEMMRHAGAQVPEAEHACQSFARCIHAFGFRQPDDVPDHVKTDITPNPLVCDTPGDNSTRLAAAAYHAGGRQTITVPRAWDTAARAAGFADIQQAFEFGLNSTNVPYIGTEFSAESTAQRWTAGVRRRFWSDAPTRARQAVYLLFHDGELSASYFSVAAIAPTAGATNWRAQFLKEPLMTADRRRDHSLPPLPTRVRDPVRVEVDSTNTARLLSRALGLWTTDNRALARSDGRLLTPLARLLARTALHNAGVWRQPDAS